MAGVLDGITIIEMAGIGPAPFCGMMLADHGARVIRVERVGAPDDAKGRDVLTRNREVIEADHEITRRRRKGARTAESGRRHHRRLSSRRDGADGAGAGCAARRQSQARLRPHDGLGAVPARSPMPPGMTSTISRSPETCTAMAALTASRPRRPTRLAILRAAA